MRKLLGSVAALVLCASVAGAQPVVYGQSGNALQSLVLDGSTVFTARDQGWYNLAGNHNPPNTNYLAGQAEGTTYRNWFVFDVPANFRGITSAVLRLNTATVIGGPATVRYWDVTTNVADLIGGTGGIGAFNDMGSGVFYGSRTYLDSDTDQILDVELNAAALQAILDARGGTFAIGGSLGSPAAVVPEPATLTLTGMGVLLVAGGAWRRRAQA